MVASLLLIALTSVGTVDSVRLGGLSHHLDSDKDYNWFHRVAIVETSSNWVGGYFRNSYHDDTFLLGKKFVKQDKGVELSLLVGASYGYREDGGCYKYQGMNNYSKRIVCPVVAPEIRLDLPASPAIAIYGNAVVLTIGLNL